MLELGSNLTSVWDEASAPIELKKRIIRTLINEIVIDINHPRATIEMQIHWAGGVHTPLIVRKNKSGRNSNAVDRDVVESVRELVSIGATGRLHTQPPLSIGLAITLGLGTWNETRVKHLRSYNQIPVFVRGTDRSWLTLEQVAATLQTGVTVVRTMIRKELLPALQVAKHAPWTREGNAAWKIFSVHKRQSKDLTQFMNQAETGGSVLRASRTTTEGELERFLKKLSEPRGCPVLDLSKSGLPARRKISDGSGRVRE